MSGKKKGFFDRFQLIVLTMIFMSSCGLKGTSSNCGAGTARISITDGTFTRECGCAEGAGTFSAQSSNFVCTIKINTTVFFDYNTQVDHYIQFGSYGIQPQTYVANSGQSTVGAATFNGTSTGVNFTDADISLSGVFVVTAQ